MRCYENVYCQRVYSGIDVLHFVSKWYVIVPREKIDVHGKKVTWIQGLFHQT